MKRAISRYAILLLACICANYYNSLAAPSGAAEEIRSNLYVSPASGAHVLLDGDLTQYDASFSNALDGMDARKMSNFSENIGMVRNNYVLVVERRQTISLTDTIFYKLWQLQQRPYQLEFVTSNLDHPGLEGYLEDKYLQTSTPVNLNGTTTIDFTINSDPASMATDRFRMIFKMAAQGPLPLSLTSFKAANFNSAIRINWKTENENNIGTFQVQRSINGTDFYAIKDIRANNFAVNNYAWLDINPHAGYNYYRISVLEKDGKEKFSEVVKVLKGHENGEVKVYPNPSFGEKLYLELINQPPGVYQIQIINSLGQVASLQRLQHQGGTLTQQDITPKSDLKKGVYHVEISTPGGKSIESIMIIKK